MDAHALMEWRGRDVVDRAGEKIGTFEELYLDAESDRPEFALVKTGLFGRRGTFVPLANLNVAGEALQVPFEKAQVKDAPSIEPDAQLSEREEAEIYRHYGLSPADVVGDDASAAEQGDTGSRGDARGSSDPEETTAGAAGHSSDQSLASASPDDATGVSGGRQAESGDRLDRHASGADPDSNDGGAERGVPDVEVGGAGAPVGRRRLRKYVITEETTVKSDLVSEELRGHDS